MFNSKIIADWLLEDRLDYTLNEAKGEELEGIKPEGEETEEDAIDVDKALKIVGKLEKAVAEDEKLSKLVAQLKTALGYEEEEEEAEEKPKKKDKEIEFDGLEEGAIELSKLQSAIRDGLTQKDGIAIVGYVEDAIGGIDLPKKYATEIRAVRESYVTKDISFAEAVKEIEEIVKEFNETHRSGKQNDHSAFLNKFNNR